LKCRCGHTKALDSYNNIFIQVVYMSDYLLEITKNPYEIMKINDLIKLEGVNYNCEKEKCMYKETKYYHEINQPYPKNLILNFNWPSNEVPSVDLLQVLLSLDDNLKLNHLYKIP